DLEAREADVAREPGVHRDAAQRATAAQTVLLLQRDPEARRRLLEARQQLDGADRAIRPERRRRGRPPAEADEAPLPAQVLVRPVDEQVRRPLVRRVVVPKDVRVVVAQPEAADL